ncbi:MAG TPA: MerR family transcriptional regulator [Pseudonocardiaceae bacterium]|jgi:DNA-binding transcriptional MerR regulator|nr:MerR family transcriptional regulator [Pseudonocardiaceae bacterium]
MRSGEVAEAAGVNVQTLRYYERRGLLAEPQRSPGGHRLYPAEAVTMVRVIRAAQRLGFTLGEIAELLALGTHRHSRTVGLRQRAATKRADIDAKIADLTVIRQALTDAIDAGCDDMSACVTDPCCPLPFHELARHEFDDRIER